MKKDAKGRNRISKVVGILILILLSACVLRAETDERLTYTVVDNGTAIEMTGCRQIETGRLVIPETVEGKPVVAVARFLKNCQALKSIHLPKTVSRVSAQSFSECPDLETIEIASDHLFYASKDGVMFDKDYGTLIRCPPGRSGKYIVPEGVTAIGDEAFYGCKTMTNIVLPESLVSIGDHAFFFCDRLESIHLPHALVSIGYAAFRHCDALVQVRIPENVSEIGGYAFSWFGFNSRLESIDVAEANEHYRSIDGVLFSRDLTRLIQYPRRKSGPYVFPEGVKYVDACAFNLCQSLTEIVFPSTLESIDSCAFELCEKLEYIRIPALVERIEMEAFKQCYGLESFMVDEANAHYVGLDGVLFDKKMKQLIQCPAKKTGIYIVPEGVEYIVSSAFDGCNGLTEIILPDTLVSIGSFAFSDCYGLTNISIPDAVETIGMDAFDQCAGLTSLFIPAGVRNVESIGLGANVVVSRENQQYTSVDGVLFSKDMTELHRCPVEKSGTFTIPGSVTKIHDLAFSGSSLQKINLSESTAVIERNAFFNCSGLKEMVFLAGISFLSEYAFNDCENMRSAYFLGDAPILESSLAFYETNPKFTVYYSSKSHGFDSPVWSGFRLRPIHPASLWLMTSGRYVFWAVLLVLLGVLLVSCWCAIRFVTRQHRRKHANGLNPNQ